MLFGKVVKNETLETTNKEIEALKKEIQILNNRLRLLNNRLPICNWVENQKKVFDLVDIEIDKFSLDLEEKENADANYIGKGFAIEFIGNKKYFQEKNVFLHNRRI